MSFQHIDSCIRGLDPQSTWQMFHVFTLGAAMLGWHGVPTGFVPGKRSYGRARSLSSSLCKHSKRVPDVNTLIIIVMWILSFLPGFSPVPMVLSV